MDLEKTKQNRSPLSLAFQGDNLCQEEQTLINVLPLLDPIFYFTSWSEFVAIMNENRHINVFVATCSTLTNLQRDYGGSTPFRYQQDPRSSVETL